MSDRDALFQRIMDQPESDEPRLAYADWLEANGDQDRAEFIRVQCSLHSASFDDGKRTELRKREQELLAQYAWEWAKDFGLDINEWQFERGFVARIQVGLETSAEKILDIVNRGPVTHLRDTGQFCELQGFVDALPKLSRLTGLEFWGLYSFENDLISQILQSEHLPNLKTLIFHHDRNGMVVDEQVIIDGLHHPNREKLEILAVNVDSVWQGPTNAILAAMADSPYLRNLKRLDLSNAGDPGNDPQLTVEAVERLSSSPNLENLEILDLRSVCATAAVWEAILKMPLLKRLKRLYLSRACEIPEGEWIPIVGQLSQIPHWREAFDSQVPGIDWETEFIDPWNDLADYWQGHTWSERRQNALFEIADFVQKRDWEGLEQHYYQLCEKDAGKEMAQTVAKISFDPWAASVHKAMKKAVKTATRRDSQTIFLRIRPDIRWQGQVCVHDQYGRDLDNTPDDSFEPYEEFSYPGPEYEAKTGDCPAAAEFLKDSPLNKRMEPNYAAIYLFARSVAAFGRVLNKLTVPQRVYCSFMWCTFRYQ